MNRPEDFARLLKEVRNISSAHQKKFVKQPVTKVQSFLSIQLLERLNINLLALIKLYLDYSVAPELEHSIGLVLRNSLSLAKISIEHMKITKTNQCPLSFYKYHLLENLREHMLISEKITMNP